MMKQSIYQQKLCVLQADFFWIKYCNKIFHKKLYLAFSKYVNEHLVDTGKFYRLEFGVTYRIS